MEPGAGAAGKGTLVPVAVPVFVPKVLSKCTGNDVSVSRSDSDAEAIGEWFADSELLTPPYCQPLLRAASTSVTELQSQIRMWWVVLETATAAPQVSGIGKYLWWLPMAVAQIEALL